MPDAILILAVVLWPMACGLATLALPRRWTGVRTAIAWCGPIGALAGLLHIAGNLQSPHVSAAWMPDFKLNLEFTLDRLGLFFAVLIAAIGLLIVPYSRAYFGPSQVALRRFYPALLLFMSAMLGLVLADNFMLMLLFWELTSISSFLLIGWNRDDAVSVRQAMQAFIVTGAGGLALLGGLLLIGIQTGFWTYSALLQNTFTAEWPLAIGMVLVFIGAAAKSAQWPLHFWLPGAMSAPTPVSAYLHSATMVKAGIYLLARLSPIVAAGSIHLPWWPTMLLAIGAITMLWGSFVALRKTDLKQIFAYTTVSQLGLLVCVIGLQVMSQNATASPINLQVLSHALYKAPLFMLTGAIAHVVHTRELGELRGLIRQPGSGRLCALLLVAALYILAAGPFTLNFAAKELFLHDLFRAIPDSRLIGLTLLATVAVGAMNTALFIRITRTLLSRPGTLSAPCTHPAQHRDGAWPLLLWVPAAAMILLHLVGGWSPAFLQDAVRWITQSPASADALPSSWHLLSYMSEPLALSIASWAGGVALAFSGLARHSLADPHDRIYPAGYALATKGGGWLFGILQTGHLRTYLYIVFFFLIGLVSWVAVQVKLPRPATLPVEPLMAVLPGGLLTVLTCTAALLIPAMRGRARRILALGTVGFCVTGFYYIYNAPDLALTQMSIEIISLMLFLLVLGVLPKQAVVRVARIPRAAVAIAVGVIVAGLTFYAATTDRPAMPWVNADGTRYANLGEFFLRNSHTGVDLPDGHGGGGNNAVNVILVDFRGFDTLGEITVLGIGALGVWTLLRRRKEPA